MDEKHRQYCIKLGNPYMNLDKYQKEYQDFDSIDDKMWIENKDEQYNNWMENKKYDN